MNYNYLLLCVYIYIYIHKVTDQVTDQVCESQKRTASILITAKTSALLGKPVWTDLTKKSDSVLITSVEKDGAQSWLM